jgi:hypothetical protein
MDNEVCNARFKYQFVQKYVLNIGVTDRHHYIFVQEALSIYTFSQVLLLLIRLKGTENSQNILNRDVRCLF